VSTILHIDSSARLERSLTRRMGRQFIDCWLELRPQDVVIYRDVGRNPPPTVSQAWIAAAFTREADRTDEQSEVLFVSDELISELERSQIIVIGAPMYNYGMPAALKAWFDMVIRVGRTFAFNAEEKTWPLSPVLTGKTLVILSSRGEFGFEPGGIREHMNHLETHIRTCAHYLGVTQTHFICTEYQEFGDERHRRSVADAEAAIGRLARSLCHCGP